MNAEFLSQSISSCINNDEGGFWRVRWNSSRRFYAPFIKMIWMTEGSSRGIKSATQHGNLRTATWRIALRQNGSLSSFSRGGGGRPLSGCNGRKGFWNMSRSCARKVLCTHLRVFAAAHDYASFFLFIPTTVDFDILIDESKYFKLNRADELRGISGDHGAMRNLK